MKVLLTTLNSKYIHSNLAVKYLYAQAKEAGLDEYIDISLIEYTINNDYSYVYGEILRGNYDVVCMSCYIWNIEQTKVLCEELKQAVPNLKIVLGGPEVSYESDIFLRENPWADCIIRGEGEDSFVQLLSEMIKIEASLKNGAESADASCGALCLNKVLSLTYRDNENDEIITTPHAPLKAMNDIVFPYKYLDIEEDKVIYYESSRGCPYRCSYCMSSIDKTVRALSLEKTKEQLMFFIDRNVKQVKFIDRTFNFDKQRALDIWRFLIENDNGITNFHFEICAETIGPEHLEVIKNAREGLFQFEIGIQSTNPKTLSAIRRSTNVSRIAENVKALLEMKNSHIHVDLIAGLPFEDFDTFRNSFNDVYTMGADNLQLGFLKLLKGTNLYKNRENFDIIYRRRAPYEVISTKFISSKELARLKMIENVLDLYHNRGGFDKSVSLLIEKSESAFDFFDSLAEFYYGCGYQHRSHKKEDLYRILNAYGVSVSRDPAEAETIRHAAEEDLCASMNSEAVKKFMRKGWEI